MISCVDRSHLFWKFCSPFLPTFSSLHDVHDLISQNCFLHLITCYIQLLNDDLYMPDHLHPSERGYHTIIGLLKPFLKQFNPLGSDVDKSDLEGDEKTEKGENGDEGIYGGPNYNLPVTLYVFTWH